MAEWKLSSFLVSAFTQVLGGKLKAHKYLHKNTCTKTNTQNENTDAYPITFPSGTVE